MSTYETLFTHSKKIRLLGSISYLLEWDQETYMPPEGANIRGDQIALMASLIHKENTSPAFAKTLGNLIDLETGEILAKELPPEKQAALRAWRRDYRQAVALPPSFVTDFAKLTSEAMTVWGKAKKQNDFSLFAPHLEKIVASSRAKADYLGFQEHPYDALLDLFEPEMTEAKITPLFATLQNDITALLGKISSRPQVDESMLHGTFPIETQLAFGQKLLDAMGYDLRKGRLDLSNHPFSVSIHPSDSRVTTRIHPTSLFDNISSVLHEGGHSLYEMGLMPEYYGSPLCEAVSLGIHESQSRLWETRIGQSRAFWSHFLPMLKESYHLPELSLDTFYKAINRVEPSFIRVESDEVTYSLHVVIRYEIEKALIEGSLEVAGIPEAWNRKMEDYLGVRPKTDAEGCLQDIHWSMGAFGYFPTYALGNLYASLFFEAFEKAHPDWETRVAAGELFFLKQWLGVHVHQHGRRYRAEELAQRISGKPLTTQPYLTYLTKKYGAIYGF